MNEEIKTEGSKGLGTFLIIAGATCWSLNAPLIKFISLDPFLVCGLRALIAGVVLLPFFRISRILWNRWLVIYTVGYGALCLTIIASLGITSATVSIGMQYTSIIWIFIVNLIISKSFEKRTGIAVIIITAGVVFFMWSGIKNGTLGGNLLALTEGIYFSIITIAPTKASKGNPLALTCFANIAVGIIVLLICNNPLAQMAAMGKTDWLVMIILGTCQLGAGYALYNLGLKYVKPQTAAILSLTEMVLGPLWVAIFLKEYPSIPEMLGFAAVLAGMIIHSTSKKV